MRLNFYFFILFSLLLKPGLSFDSLQWKNDSVLIESAVESAIKNDFNQTVYFIEKGNDIDTIVERTAIRLLEHAERDKAIKVLKINAYRLENSNNKEDLVRSYLLMGGIFGALHNNDKSFENFKKALEITETIEENDHLLTKCYLGLQSVHMDYYHYDSSYYYGMKALKNATSLADTFGLVLVHSSFAVHYQMKREWDKFEESLLEEKRLLELYMYPNGTIRKNVTDRETKLYSIFLTNFSNYYTRNGDWENALKYAHKGEELAEELDNKSLLEHAHRKLAEAYHLKGDHDKAWDYMQKFLVDLRDTYNRERTTKAEEFDAKFETRKKEERIRRLDYLNSIRDAELERKNTLIWSAIITGLLAVALLALVIYILRNRSKKREVELEHQVLRTQMNPHFIFNSLNSIQRLYVEGNFDQADDYMADFSELIRETLDNSDRKAVLLKEDMKALDLYLNMEKVRAENKFDFSIEIADNIDPLMVKVPPFLIQPFVENSIWHGIMPKEGSGRINVTIKRESDKLLRCEVRDNGVGMKAAESTIKKHKSKALSIVQERIGANNPIVFPETQEGTSVILLIPTEI